MSSGSYSQAFAKLGRWAIGQRAVHDLFIHPFMALTGYSNLSVKLHDYHAFATLRAQEGLIGITGARPDVERTLARLDIGDEQVRHFHTDGMLCFGLVEPDRIGPKKTRVCPRCQGSGEVVYTANDGFSTRKTCPDCKGYGEVSK